VCELIGGVENFFIGNGYKAEKDIELKGLSGIRHRFPLILIKNGVKIAVEFSDGVDPELDLLKLMIKCRDVGISKAFLILMKDCYPIERLYEMAGRNGIRILKYPQLKVN
jgi:hypothetical protein